MSLYVEIDSDDDNFPDVNPFVLTKRQLDAELDSRGIPWERPEGYMSLDPIINVKACRIGDEEFKYSFTTRYQALKPLWVEAEIWKYHLGTGEHTTAVAKLRNIIRRRGKGDDDCGHIIGAALGGKMVDINLFPQNQHLNRGGKGNYLMWRIIEEAIRLWVKTIPEELRPRVHFQMLLNYGEQNHPNRPDQFKYSLQFLRDSVKEESNDDTRRNEPLVISQTVLNVAAVSLQCYNEGITVLKERIQQISAKLPQGCTSRTLIKKYLEDVSGFLHEKPMPKPRRPSPERQPSPPPSPLPRFRRPPLRMHRDRGVSVLDFVPVVGSAKTLIEGCEDISDGNVIGGVTNLAIGGVCMFLDVVTIGGLSSILAVGKVGAKEAAKAVAKGVVKKTAASYCASTGLKASRHW